jgi:hypothetical protein
MKRFALLAVFAAAVITSVWPKEKKSPFVGRWDLSIKTPGESYPSWMEFTANDATPVVRIVGRVASVHPATNVKVSGSRLTFSTSEWFDKPIPVTWDMTVAKGSINGIQQRSDGVEGEISGVPAPPLGIKLPSWWKPESLFNGKDLSGWEPDDPSKNHWKAEDGALVNEAAGANIRTTREFTDFKLHIEFNCPEGGNSGVYLRGRYEVQVEYEPAGTDDALHSMGSIYGFIAPGKEVFRRPGEWESFDVTLVGRTVTVARDGTTIIDRKEIPGITGGALNSHEAEPGPIYIQGDHTGGMKYRNITISHPQTY